MRNSLRVALVAPVMGMAVMTGASSASAVEACEYPFDCVPIEGNPTDEAVGAPAPVPTDTSPDASTPDDAVKEPISVSAVSTGPGSPSGTQLPVTGGEAVLLAMTGLGAVVGGTAFVVAGRRRAASA